jgi:nucleotide-binding universal stress UspA family protein
MDGGITMTNTHETSVVVGVDGSPSALHAVRWAAHEAARRGSTLRLVHVGHLEPVRHPRQISPPREYRTAILEQGQHFLDEASEAARNTEPDLPVTTDLHTGNIADILVTESKHTQLMVLGSRGLGGFGSLLLGSVAVALAAHGHCPIVVINAPTPDSAPPENGPIVVGVDGSELSDTAVTFAFQTATARNVPVLAVHTYDVDVPGSWTAQLETIDWDSLQAQEEKQLTERLAPWCEKFPEVEAHTVLVRGRPARALLEQAADAQLIVVGSRGRGAFTGLGLGSVSQTVLHHAKCPVAVARTR